MKKTLVITGGSRGIGAEISRAFVKAGYYVLIGARKETGITELLGKRARFKSMDVSKEEDHQKLAAAALRWTGKIDVYLNCAGFSKWSPIGKVDETFWNKMIDTNLKGTFWGCKVASKYLQKWGCIINISSIAGKRGTANNSVYCASKFGVTGLTQALSKELGPKGIRVNAVCPVLIMTPGLKMALSEDDSPIKGGSISVFLKKFTKEQTALNRLPTAAEVAQVCLWLASPAASAITGQSVTVDCGVFPQ